MFWLIILLKSQWWPPQNIDNHITFEYPLTHREGGRGGHKGNHFLVWGQHSMWGDKERRSCCGTAAAFSVCYRATVMEGPGGCRGLHAELEMSQLLEQSHSIALNTRQQTKNLPHETLMGLRLALMCITPPASSAAVPHKQGGCFALAAQEQFNLSYNLCINMQ